jgi:hypothetical protein
MTVRKENNTWTVDVSSGKRALTEREILIKNSVLQQKRSRGV